jgi:hypothetical protein
MGQKRTVVPCVPFQVDVPFKWTTARLSAGPAGRSRVFHGHRPRNPSWILKLITGIDHHAREQIIDE